MTEITEISKSYKKLKRLEIELYASISCLEGEKTTTAITDEVMIVFIKWMENFDKEVY